MAKRLIIKGAREHNLKALDTVIDHQSMTAVTGVSGSGKSSLVFDTILKEAQRRFFYTLSHYTRQFLNIGTRPKFDEIEGLSPAIALAQNETMPTIRANIANLTDLGELFAVVFSNYAQRFCPEHDQPTEAVDLDFHISNILSNHSQKMIAVLIPIAENKPGMFKKELKRALDLGYLRVYCDGELQMLSGIEALAKERKHTLKIVVDVVRVSQRSADRIKKSVQAAFDWGESFCQICEIDEQRQLRKESFENLSLLQGCSQCGFSWPSLDTRHFSINSLGRCLECDGIGGFVNEIDESFSNDIEDCDVCMGTGLSHQVKAVRFYGYHIHQIYNQSFDELLEFIEKIRVDAVQESGEGLARVLQSIVNELSQLCKLKIGYLNLARKLKFLSSGELQRAKIAGLLTDSLRGIIYILDEPSQGLHASQIEELISVLKDIQKLGNTILMVDHDQSILKAVDCIIDMGPGGGQQGGDVIAQFSPVEVSQYADQSRTAYYLHSGLSQQGKPSTQASLDFLFFEGVAFRFLQISQLKLACAGFNLISGVSGSSKSTLLYGVLWPVLQAMKTQGLLEVTHQRCFKASSPKVIDDVLLVDRKPLHKSSQSTPATYLGVFSFIRKLFESLPDSQILGLSARSFSLSLEGGRCPSCKGKGVQIISMRFLSDARVKCVDCNGSRFKSLISQVKYKGFSLPDIMEMSINSVYEHFSFQPQIKKRLQPAIDLGLGYLKFGQTSDSLSGGEAQRLKLCPLLSKAARSTQHQVLLLDEPTRGLHIEDMGRLFTALHQLNERGITVVLIEHSLEAMRQADWINDLGPGAGVQGGRIIFEGTQEDLIRYKGPSETARQFQSFMNKSSNH